MKITIEAETPEEKQKLAEPWVRTGAERFFLAGRLNPKAENFEFGFVHGPWMANKIEVARASIELDAMEGQQRATAAVIQAHNVMAEQENARRIGESLRNGHHPRLAK